MPLSLPDKWIWDFWLVDDQQGLFHVFYLQAPRTLGNPELRHWNVSIGHAVSTDLTEWTLRPDALGPPSEPGWDDASTWTGSIIRHGQRWILLYTGTSNAEDGLVQRVGMAVSDDLDNWVRHPGPLIEADPQRYERLGDGWADEVWRDPWIFQADDGYHALITARSKTGDWLDRGCIAHASSEDLVTWHVQGPITTPGGFGQMEVPQVHCIDGRWFLLFCSDVDTQSLERREEGEGTGTFFVAGDGPLGPFAAEHAKPLLADASGSSYAGRVIDYDGTIMFLSWKRSGPDGGFIGELCDPRPVVCVGSGIELAH